MSHPHKKSTPRRRAKALPALLIFARTPTPGKAKTRLIPLLGPRAAAEFHAALLADTLRKVNALTGQIVPYFYLAGSKFPASSSLLDYRRRRQSGADLGARLDRALRDVLPRHHRAVVIGTDSPGLTRGTVSQAFGELNRADAVLGPCPDGGFYLIGLRRTEDGIFDGVRWGSESAFDDMRGNLLAHGLACSVLAPLPDVDRPEDVRKLVMEMKSSRAARNLAPSTWEFLRNFFVLKSRERSPVRTSEDSED